MSRHLATRTALLLALSAALLPACGGGGGGGGSNTSAVVSGSGGSPGTESLDPAKHFFLANAAFARPIKDVDGNLDTVQPLVNPASLFETDPLTNVALEGFPKTLVPGDSLSTLENISFPQVLDPITPQIPLIPRNAALVLGFSQAIDLTTLFLDDSDPNAPGKTTGTSAIQVRDATGVLQVAQVLPDPTDPKRLVILGVSSGSSSWPPSPLLFDSQGKVVQNPQGHLKVTVVLGQAVFSSTSGKSLVNRTDKLGSSVLPLPFNPGNSQLDAIVLQTEAGKIGFNGFLPDLTPPRIVRPVKLSSQVTSILGNEMRVGGLLTPPNVTANGGAGEWANALLTITSDAPAGGTFDTQYVVDTNFNELGGTVAVFRLGVGESFNLSVAPGDDFTVTRSEFFEPVPPPLPSNPADLAKVTVDPLNHPRDPNDPQDLLNSDLRYFVRMFDVSGPTDVERTDVWDPSQHLFQPIPPKTSLRMEFSEAMDPASLRAYESFYVSDALGPVTDPAFSDMRVGVTEASADGRTANFHPFLEDQVIPANSSYVGFGGSASVLRLVLRTRPEAATINSLTAAATPDVLAKLVDLDTTGVVGCTDLGGRGLGMPPALFDQGDAQNFLLASGSAGQGAFPPAVDFSLEFETASSPDKDYGVIVHRFMGQATTALFNYPSGSIHDEVTQGIEYHDYPAQDVDANGSVDRRFIYGPTLLEVGLNVPGQLTGASAATIEHLIDNFNKPKRSAFASPNGEDFLVSVGFGLGMPINSGYGARFQHVYRSGDASPSELTFKGSVLDLVGLAWSPFSNFISNTKLDGFEILVGLSGAGRGEGPSTLQTNGIPTDVDSGIVSQFDCNRLEWLDNCVPAHSELNTIVKANLKQAVSKQPKTTNVVKKGTPYIISSANKFNPANASGAAGGFNQYLDFPQFNTGIDPVFGREDVFSFPYDSTFPMLLEYQIEANETVPSRLNFFRFSPGILSSALPRFRVWSQGQHPMAHAVPNWTLNVGPPAYTGQKKFFRAGEGGPLVEPGCLIAPLEPPDDHNGMPTIPVDSYILPPVQGNSPLQPAPDWVRGDFDVDDDTPSFTAGCITKFPTPNTNPYTNFYHANGMLMYPLPNLVAYPGPSGSPPTMWYGYGVSVPAICGVFHPLCNPETLTNGGLPCCWPGTGGTTGVPCKPVTSFTQCPNGNAQGNNDPCLIPGELGISLQLNNPPVTNLEPGMTTAPALYGDNSRYYMMWKYRKRVSIIESPTIQATSPTGEVRYLRPIVDPPLASVDPAASMRMEIKAGSLLDFTVPALDSGYVDMSDPSYESTVTGPTQDRTYVKFRASFGVAANQNQPPTIETVIIPYEKIKP